MTTETLLAARLLVAHGCNRIHVADLDSYEQELFDKVLSELDTETLGDWTFEGAINLYCRNGSVQIYGSNCGL